jgi:hypothetical protein
MVLTRLLCFVKQLGPMSYGKRGRSVVCTELVNDFETSFRTI